MLSRYRLPLRDLDALASGLGSATTIAALRAAQLSLRLIGRPIGGRCSFTLAAATQWIPALRPRSPGVASRCHELGKTATPRRAPLAATRSDGSAECPGCGPGQGSAKVGCGPGDIRWDGAA